jgi:hypothetical protein
MALDYKTWLRLTGRKPTADSAQTWKITHGVALGLYDRNGNRIAPVTPLDPATPPEPQPIPVDPARESAIDDRRNRLSALPGLYNTRRKDLAATTAAQLVESGLTDRADLEEVPAGDGNVVWRVVVGPDGRLYRQAFRQTRDAFNARGLLGSSFQRRQYEEQRGALDTSVAQAMRAYDQNVRGITESQRQEAEGLGNDITQAQIEYGDWKRAQPPVLPKPPPAPPVVNTAAPVTPGGPQPHARPISPKPVTRPTVTYDEFVRTHGGKSTAALAATWRKRFGGG